MRHIQIVELSLRLILMWSVPFNLNIHNSGYAVWLIDTAAVSTNR